MSICVISEHNFSAKKQKKQLGESKAYMNTKEHVTKMKESSSKTLFHVFVPFLKLIHIYLALLLWQTFVSKLGFSRWEENPPQYTYNCIHHLALQVIFLQLRSSVIPAYDKKEVVNITTVVPSDKKKCKSYYIYCSVFLTSSKNPV